MGVLNKMIITIFNKLQFRFYMSILEEREGICSQKSDGEDSHMLLWDFDNEKLSDIVKELRRVMLKFELPKVYILQSSPSGYHAYCFAKRTFRDIIIILANTSLIDMHYLRLGMVRGYYTLRYSARGDGQPQLVKVLQSAYSDELSPLDVTTNKYFTNNKGVKNAKG